MEKVHSDKGEVLIEVSPLIDFTGSSEINLKMPCVKTPVHTKKQNSNGKDTQQELAQRHDFMSKLLQPSAIKVLKDYITWQRMWRTSYEKGVTIEEALKSAPDYAPISIHVDLTTACNYKCDHCVDMDILNTGIQYDHEKLLNSINSLIAKGLRSVILIGGGEPTAYPGFGEVVRTLKAKDIQVGIVTNGSMLSKVEDIVDVLDKNDWIRLSLDSGSNETFRAMHKPGSKKVTLDWICSHIKPIKQKNPEVQIGYSFIIVWDDCETNNFLIIENLDEMEEAAARAKDSGFDYISFKPFLTRGEVNNQEIVALSQDEPTIENVMQKIRSRIEKSKELEDADFKVVESTNLKVFENGSYQQYTEQPHNCHMQFFRHVLSPLGVYNCPVYRHVPQALLGGKHSFETEQGVQELQKNALRLIDSFDATEECKEVTCLYNHANWVIEGLIQNPEELDVLLSEVSGQDFFL